MSNAIRGMRRQTMRKHKLPSTLPFGNGASVDVMSMELPDALVVNVDTESVYFGEAGKRVADLTPAVVGINSIDTIEELLSLIDKRKDTLQKVVMTATESAKDGEDTDAKPSFKVLTVDNFVDRLQKYIVKLGDVSGH